MIQCGKMWHIQQPRQTNTNQNVNSQKTCGSVTPVAEPRGVRDMEKAGHVMRGRHRVTVTLAADRFPLTWAVKDGCLVTLEAQYTLTVRPFLCVRVHTIGVGTTGVVTTHRHVWNEIERSLLLSLPGTRPLRRTVNVGYGCVKVLRVHPWLNQCSRDGVDAH